MRSSESIRLARIVSDGELVDDKVGAVGDAVDAVFDCALDEWRLEELRALQAAVVPAQGT